ncbi:UbiA prenyltransferase [Thermodesulfatator indicus DSM 15286]|uniref:UbiA prenyltransferase n=1 Tax=Thermodesulfatator indicus (strain DSM 15286 / JCM 11887 / CIR29812) TaxID=667014 RepID=F8ABJ8_THEID|nr:UbiA prenyltransferase family protein [Thermodesulfatator indicus]AEH45595.1 UbiA prenyltransferase [Thermodesulfatator indicus DSM 15286]
MKNFDFKAYIAIARPDHWFKNGFMVLGILLAFFIEPQLIKTNWYLKVLLGIIVACLVASSNYVINEILDAPKDALHPTKKNRPIPSGRVYLPLAYAEWLILAVIGLSIAYKINMAFFLSALWLWVMGFFYNVPPFRTKDIPYLDVLTEAINNPIRLFLGWFVLITNKIPPLSLVVAYWMAGAFFMAAKRFAEYRMIGDPERAAKYRKSFAHYTEERLLISIFYYAIFCAFFLGIFIVRYHLELLLCVPLLAGFFAYYLKIAFRDNSPVQRPEHLYRETGLMLYLGVCFTAFVFLLFVKIPVLYKLFKIIPYNINPLWEF